MQTSECLPTGDLDGRELSAAVAHEVFEHGGAPLEVDEHGYVHSLRFPNSEVVHVPDYSTTIACAWRIVEKLSDPENGKHFAIGQEAPSGTWIADYWRDTREPVHGIGDTAPEAICRAALKAVRTNHHPALERSDD